MMGMSILTAALLLLGSTSASLVDQKVRLDFVQAMNQATNRQPSKYLRELQRRLMAKARPHRVLDQGDDAAQNDDDAAANDDQYVNDDGLDLREYAFKYVGCQTINSWSDNMAEDEDSETVFAKNSFAVFRMCPLESCSTYNKYGCLYDYGEYMILMEDYLAIMAEYHFSRYVEYCQTCQDCMNGGGNNRRRLADDDAANDDAAGDDAANDDAAGDDAANDDAANDDAAAAGDDGVQCEYADACANYQDACVNYSDDEVLYDDYFECAQLQGGGDDDGGNAIYLGPHCMSDGVSITIGVFSDEYCTEYVGSMADMEQSTGLSYDSTSMAFYYTGSCVSCDATEQYDLDQNDEDGIYDLCEALYDASAKCNRYLYEADKYESDNQEETEDEVCNFIESLVMNTYDENGEINLAKMYFDISNWKSVTEYTKIVSPGQIVGLLISILLMVGLAIYAIFLYYQIKRANQLNVYRTSPRNNYDPNANLAGKISRVHSGIMNSRSRSADASSYQGGAYA